jgi:hypothetical protein
MDPFLCRDRLDLGWSIEKVFGKKGCSSKQKVMVNGVECESFREGEINKPSSSSIQGVVDAEYISKPRDMTNRSLIRNTEPFFFGRHIYPSMYLMLMSCEGVTKKQALRGSQALAKQRRKHFTEQRNIGCLADTFELAKPAYLSGLQRFIFTISKCIDLTDCFYDGTLKMHKRLADNGFCRQRYLSFYNLNDQIGLEPILENSLYKESTFSDKSLIEVDSKVACNLLNITDDNLRKRRERVAIKEELWSVNQVNTAVLLDAIKRNEVANRIREIAEEQ